MQKKVFIQTNNKQLLGAYIAKFSIEHHLIDKNSVSVEFINVDELKVFKNFSKMSSIRKLPKNFSGPKAGQI